MCKPPTKPWFHINPLLKPGFWWLFTIQGIPIVSHDIFMYRRFSQYIPLYIYIYPIIIPYKTIGFWMLLGCFTLQRLMCAPLPYPHLAWTLTPSAATPSAATPSAATEAAGPARAAAAARGAGCGVGVGCSGLGCRDLDVFWSTICDLLSGNDWKLPI